MLLLQSLRERPELAPMASSCPAEIELHSAQILVQHVLGKEVTPLQARAAERLFRPQKVSVLEGGTVMAAEHESVERHAQRCGRSAGLLGHGHGCRPTIDHQTAKLAAELAFGAALLNAAATAICSLCG